MPRRTKKAHLSVYLMNEECKQHADILKNTDQLEKFQITGHEANRMCLYAKKSFKNLPKWLNFFKGKLNRATDFLFSSSTSAVLIVRHGDRFFSYCFGYGRTLLNLDQVVESFGLKVVLNAVHADRLRSVDVKNLDTILRHSHVEVSQTTSIDGFGTNLDRDILNAAVGISDDPRLGRVIAGSTALHLAAEIDIDGLEQFCGLLLQKYRETKYRERFAWVDHVSEIKNKATISELNQELVSSINEDNYEGLYLASPDLIDWERVGGFKYAMNDESIEDDVSFSAILTKNNKRLSDVDLEWLKNGRIYCVSRENDDIISNWSIYKAINFELKKASEFFLLTAGRWFRIDKKYATDVDEIISEIDECANLPFPTAIDGESEQAYNQRTCTLSSSRCHLMDRVMIRYGGGNSQIELCDIVVDTTKLSHVKRFRGSSTLSHLFFQGLNSAFLLRSDVKFVRAANKRLPPHLQFADPGPIDTSKYHIVFAIISKSRKGIAEIIPFFSKTSLVQVWRQLQVYGYKVCIQKISVA